MSRAQDISRADSPIPYGARTPKKSRNVLVLGAGNFGSCLADHLADSGHDVRLWARDASFVEHFNANRKHLKCLQEHNFHSGITAVSHLPSQKEIQKLDLILFAIPTEGVRAMLTQLRPLLDPNHLPLLIFVNKGIEISTRALTLEIIVDTCGQDIARAAIFVSGPSFAKEIVKRQPTSVSVVSLTQENAQRTSEIFHQPWFRCYTGHDPIGVELAGAIKNVVAIAAGVADGLGFENNTRAMLITRGLAEMTRISVAYGASPLTFLGLAGVGDLFLTCSSSSSRNYTVGYRLGRGEKLDYIIETLGSVAEGVTTAKALHELLKELGTDVNATIANAVYQILYEDRNVEEAAKGLLELPPLKELDLPVEAGAPARRLLEKLSMS